MPHGTLAQVAQTSYMKGEFLYLSFIIMSIINIQGGSQLSLLEIIGIIGLIILISLNPCCAGRCSSTRKTETVLIINMLQNYAKVIFAFLNQKLTIS